MIPKKNKNLKTSTKALYNEEYNLEQGDTEQITNNTNNNTETTTDSYTKPVDRKRNKPSQQGENHCRSKKIQTN